MRRTIKRKLLPPYLAQLSRKQNANIQVIEPGDSVEIHGTFWDGGSRNEYRQVKIGGGEFGHIARGSDPFTTALSGSELLKKGYLIIQTGTFCGKPATMTVYVRDDDLLNLAEIPDIITFDPGTPLGLYHDYLLDHAPEHVARFDELFIS